MLLFILGIITAYLYDQVRDHQRRKRRRQQNQQAIRDRYY